MPAGMDYSNKWDQLDDLDDEELPGLTYTQIKEVRSIRDRFKLHMQRQLLEVPEHTREAVALFIGVQHKGTADGNRSDSNIYRHKLIIDQLGKKSLENKEGLSELLSVLACKLGVAQGEKATDVTITTEACNVIESVIRYNNSAYNLYEAISHPRTPNERELRKQYVSNYFGRRKVLAKQHGSLSDSKSGLHMAKEDFEKFLDQTMDESASSAWSKKKSGKIQPRGYDDAIQTMNSIGNGPVGGASGAPPEALAGGAPGGRYGHGGISSMMAGAGDKPDGKKAAAGGAASSGATSALPPPKPAPVAKHSAGDWKKALPTQQAPQRRRPGSAPAPAPAKPKPKPKPAYEGEYPPNMSLAEIAARKRAKSQFVSDVVVWVVFAVSVVGGVYGIWWATVRADQVFASFFG